jgi:hypothetical protein
MGRGPFCGGSASPAGRGVPADADGPVLKAAMWYPYPEATVLILTNQGGETLCNTLSQP